MVNYILRLVGLVPYTRIEDSIDDIISEFEIKRAELRKASLDEIETLNPTKDGEKIQKILMEMNRGMNSMYEKEIVLRELLTKVK